MRRRTLFLFCGPLLSALVAMPAAGYIANNRWTTTATNGGAGSRGTPITLTWSIVADGTSLSGTPSNLRSFLDTNFGVGPGGSNLTQRPWFPIFQNSFDRMGQLAGVTYVYEPADDGAGINGFGAAGALGVRGDVRIGGMSYGAGSNTLASNFFPNNADMMINTDQVGFFTNASTSFRAFRNTIMHEAMHGLGIDHIESTSARFLIEPFLSTAFDGPQLDDLLAMQRLYGDVLERNGGNDAFTAATPLGVVGPDSARQIGLLGNSTVITPGQTDFVSIDDDSDIDFFSFTLNEVLDVSLALSPRGATYQIGPEGGFQAAYNSKSLGNLSLALLDPSGTLALQMSNASGLGGDESITRLLDPGTYYARVRSSSNDVQLYQLAITATAIGPDDLRWTGNVSGAWDVATSANFTNALGADVFRNQDHVTFNDDAATKAVHLPGPVSPGSVLIDAASTYVFTGAGMVAGALTIDGGGVVELANSGNSYAGATNVLAGVLRITGDANAMASPITIAAGATLVLDATDAATMASPIEVESGGTLQVGAAATAANVLPDSPAGVVNHGTIRILDDELITHFSGDGLISVEQEHVEFAANDFTGLVLVHSGAVAEVRNPQGLGSALGGTEVLSGGSVLVASDLALGEPFSLTGDGGGQGALHLAAGSTAMLMGVVTLVDAGATVRLDAGASAVFYDAIVGAADGATLTLDVAGGAAIDLTGAVMLGVGGLTKRGDGVVEITADFDVQGRTSIEAGMLRLAGSGDLGGAFHVAGGVVLEVDGVHSFEPTAAITGDGVINGNITMPGAIAPGDPIGVLSFADGLMLAGSSVMQFDFGGTLAAIEYDQVRVSDGVLLDGGLEVALQAGFTPALGQAFTLLEAGVVAGAFASPSLPGLEAGLAWELAYLPQRVVLSVVPAPTFAPADFNDDGVVDGADLALWQAGYATSGATHIQGDADGDLLVDGTDFLAWQRQVGGGPPTVAAAVPEPAAWLIAAAAIAVGAASTMRSPRRASSDIRLRSSRTSFSSPREA